MGDSFKTWLVEVACKQMGPSIIKAALAAVTGYILAHAGALSAMGVDYDSVDNTIDISLNKLSAWALVAGPAGIMGLMTLFQHHATAAVTGAPQSGDKREDGAPVIDGQRKDDPKTQGGTK
jgi:hypothetical protein